MGGILPFHPNRAAAAPDVTGKAKKLLDMNHFHTLVTGSSCSFLQIQFAADGYAKYMDPVFRAPCHKGLKDLLRRHADGGCRMHTIQIVFVIFVERFPTGNTSLFYKADCVCFISHMITDGIIR